MKFETVRANKQIPMVIVDMLTAITIVVVKSNNNIIIIIIIIIIMVIIISSSIINNLRPNLKFRDLKL